MVVLGVDQQQQPADPEAVLQNRVVPLLVDDMVQRVLEELLSVILFCCCRVLSPQLLDKNQGKLLNPVQDPLEPPEGAGVDAFAGDQPKESKEALFSGFLLDQI